jgi:hypothetical protein
MNHFHASFSLTCAAQILHNPISDNSLLLSVLIVNISSVPVPVVFLISWLMPLCQGYIMYSKYRITGSTQNRFAGGETVTPPDYYFRPQVLAL